MFVRFAAIGFCAALGALPQTQAPNFSGTWIYEGMVGRIFEVDTIRHSGPDFAISERRRNQDLIYENQFRTDGQILEKKWPGIKVERSARWEGDTLVLETRVTDSRGETTEFQRLTLSSDGTTMTKRTHWSGPEKHADDVMQFQKKAAQ